MALPIRSIHSIFWDNLIFYNDNLWHGILRCHHSLPFKPMVEPKHWMFESLAWRHLDSYLRLLLLPSSFPLCSIHCCHYLNNLGNCIQVHIFHQKRNNHNTVWDISISCNCRQLYLKWEQPSQLKEVSKPTFIEQNQERITTTQENHWSSYFPYLFTNSPKKSTDGYSKIIATFYS